MPAYEEFCQIRANWLEDYALFRALKVKYNGASYLEWPAELVQREPSALARARRDLANEIDQVRLAQFLLFRQGNRLKEYARAKGVRLIGDLPFFVSPDSSDVWANPELFLLDERRRPRFVAGVPPDYFSAQGQLWGNPVYDWEAHRRTGYAWCIDRIRAATGPRGRDSPGSFPRVRGRLARTCRVRLPRKPANGCPVRAPSSSAPYERELGSSAVHRRGPGLNHA